MIGNYQLSTKKGRDVKQYIYPAGSGMRCLVDAGAALLQGFCILIEPPDRLFDGADQLVRRVEG